jgi:hypothetical protein
VVPDHIGFKAAHDKLIQQFIMNNTVRIEKKDFFPRRILFHIVLIIITNFLKKKKVSGPIRPKIPISQGGGAPLPPDKPLPPHKKPLFPLLPLAAALPPKLWSFKINRKAVSTKFPKTCGAP